MFSTRAEKDVTEGEADLTLAEIDFLRRNIVARQAEMSVTK